MLDKTYKHDGLKIYKRMTENRTSDPNSHMWTMQSALSHKASLVRKVQGNGAGAEVTGYPDVPTWQVSRAS